MKLDEFIENIRNDTPEGDTVTIHCCINTKNIIVNNSTNMLNIITRGKKK